MGEGEQTRVWKIDRHEVNFQKWDKTNTAVVAAEAQLAAVFPVREGLGAVMLFAYPLPTEEEAAKVAEIEAARARMEAMFAGVDPDLVPASDLIPQPGQLPLEMRDLPDTLTEADFAELLKSAAEQAESAVEGGDDDEQAA